MRSSGDSGGRQATAWGHAGLAVLLGSLCPSVAGAAEPAGGGDQGISTVLVLLAFVTGAYLIAHFVVDWVQRRLLVVSGLEYVVLGMLLGPVVVPQLHAFADLTSLAPVIAFAAGWIGLLYGMELDLRTMLAIPDRSLRVAVVESLVIISLVTGGALWLFHSPMLAVEEVDPRRLWLSALVLGVAAAAASSSAVDLLSVRYPDIETQLLPLLRRTARLEDLLAIAVFGVLYCVFHEGVTNTEHPPAFSDWILLTLGLGISLGVLFTLFLGDGAENRFLALVGIILFASGAAFFLNLSVLVVNLLLGVVIVNTRHGKGVFETLQRTQKPVRLILLVFAGALWVPVPLGPAVVLTVAVIGLRLLGKTVACALASLGTSLRNDLFRGLMAQGDVAVAMAISFQLVYDGPTVDLAYTAILASVVFYEAIAPRLLKGLLVDAGELRQDVDTAPPASAAGG